MTNDRFDDLTKLIGQRASRRTVLKGVFASALAAVFGRVATSGTRAVHVPCVGTKPNNNTCTADSQCCSNNCVAQPNGRPSRCVACFADSQCESGACIHGICLRSRSTVGGVCVTDSHCQDGLTCEDGVCTLTCPAGQSACGTTCCATGQCNATTNICCTAGQSPCGRGCCPSGRCNQTTGVCCPAGQSACGRQCCATGQCNQSTGVCCPAGSTACGSTCCPSGRCNQASGTCCPSTQVACGTGCCSGGQCNQTSGICCPLGQKPCGDGCCDPDLCTDVGICCSGGTVICADGTCGLAVGTGTCVTSDDCCGDDTFCDGTGTCQTLNTDPNPGCQGADACLGDVQCGDPGVDCRCGTTIEGGGVCWAAETGCGRAGGAIPCETSSDCASGLCVATPNACGANGAGICPNSSGVCVDPCSSLGCPFEDCAPGETCCSLVCSDLTSDINNCGACGTACTAPANGTPTCANGICGFQCDAGAILCGGTACCGASEFCDGGTSTCQPLNTDPTTLCQPGNACTGDTPCGAPGSTCYCGQTIEGGGVCFESTSGCNRPGGAITCTSSHECPTGLCVATPNACNLPGICPDSPGVCVDECATIGCPFEACAAGETCCSLDCTDLQTDVNNCGGCGFACPPIPNATVVCTLGGCDYTCDAGALVCGAPGNGGGCCGATEYCDGATSTCQPLNTSPNDACVVGNACTGDTPCGAPGNNCFCGQTIEGGGVCWDAATGCGRLPVPIPCETSRDCATGLCVATPNACGAPGVCPNSSGVCVDPCGQAASPYCADDEVSEDIGGGVFVCNDIPVCPAGACSADAECGAGEACVANFFNPSMGQCVAATGSCTHDTGCAANSFCADRANVADGGGTCVASTANCSGTTACGANAFCSKREEVALAGACVAC